MNGVSKITATEEVALVTFRKMSADPSAIAFVFSAFANAGINIDMISQTAPQGLSTDLSFTVSSAHLMRVLEQVKTLRETHAELTPMVSSGNCKLQLYGEEMRAMGGVAAAAMTAVAKSGAELILITTSEVDISLLITQSHFDEAVQALEETFGVTA